MPISILLSLIFFKINLQQRRSWILWRVSCDKRFLICLVWSLLNNKKKKIMCNLASSHPDLIVESKSVYLPFSVGQLYATIKDFWALSLKQQSVVALNKSYDSSNGITKTVGESKTINCESYRDTCQSLQKSPHLKKFLLLLFHGK